MRTCSRPSGRICRATALVAVWATLATSADAQSLPLRVRFLGNMAFQITDGTTTVVSDFPYRSGASGYMSYDARVLDTLGPGVALITHEHADHWEPTLFDRLDLDLIAPPVVAATVDSSRVLPWSDSIRLNDVEVQPVHTPHTESHVSYRVLWGGRRLYFTGDTEDSAHLLAERDLDVAFVSPWLLRKVLDAGQNIDADLVVVYHHAVGEEIPRGAGIHVPVQGSEFVVH